MKLTKFKKLSKIISVIILSLIIAVILLVASSKLLEKQIVNRAITELNKTIDAPIIVDNISFTLIKRFPQATIQFKNVTILSSKTFNTKYFDAKETDTLAQIQNIFVSINIKALLDNTFEVKKVEINKANINALIDEKGKNNYQIFRQIRKSENIDSNQFNIKLNEIELIQTKVKLKNLFKKSNIQVSAPKLLAKGSFYKNIYNITSSGDLILNKLSLGQSVFSPNFLANFKLQMSYSNDTISVKSSEINTASGNFNINGYSVLNKPNYTNVNIKGNNISILHLIQLLPTNQNLKYIKTNGKFDFEGIIKGNISNTISPYMLANFGIKNGSLRYKDSLNINKINLQGRFSNGSKRNRSTMDLNIKNFSFDTDSSKFSGSFLVQNFINPKYNISSQFKINLAELNQFISNNAIQDLSGKIDGKVETKGLINDTINIDSLAFILNNTNGKIKVSNLALRLPEQHIILSKTSGNINYKSNHIYIDSAQGIFNDITTKVNSVTIKHLNAIFNKNNTLPLSIRGNFKFDKANFTNIKPLFESSDSNSTSTPFIIKGNATINNYIHNKINASNLNVEFNLSNNRYIIPKLSFNAFGGHINAAVHYSEKTKSKSILQIKAQTTLIDIKQYFAAFDNFNQNNLTHENINGKLTSDFDCELTLINNEIDIKSTELLGYAKIMDGQLINYAPIQELARFTNIDELNNISFSTLENEIMISNNTIHIPQMEINSTAFDITLFGKQDLNGDYEYHIRVYLSDILSGKTKQLQKQQSEFGVIEDDGLGKPSIFLISTYSDGKAKTRLDRKQLRTHLKTEFSNEKQELKQLFNEEFHRILIDTAKQPTTKNKKQENTSFEIEWDDE